MTTRARAKPKPAAAKKAAATKAATTAVVKRVAKTLRDTNTTARSAGTPESPSVTAPESAAAAAKLYETVVLVLQGGGALGSYQCGVYEGLHEAGIRPDWFAGTSIGAINASILAGNAPEDRLPQLQKFWELICTPALPLPPPLLDLIEQQSINLMPQTTQVRSFANTLGAINAIVHGQRGFFTPRWPPSMLAAPGTDAATSLYDTRPLKATLERFVDFDRINHPSVRFTVGAVNARTGNFKYFDNRHTRIRVEHVLASGALPPTFPSIEIDGERYWDGGVVSNTPLEYVVEAGPRRDALVFQVDLWSASGILPRTIPEVIERLKDVQYSSRTRAGTKVASDRQKLRLAIGKLIELIPKKELPTELRKSLDPWTCDKVLNIVHLIYKSKPFEEQHKDYAFDPLTMRAHWACGVENMTTTLTHRNYFDLPSRDVGVVTHDIHR